MDIEYFPETRVLLIYGHEPKIVADFREQIIALAEGRKQRFAVHELDGFRSIGVCQFFATLSNTGDGVSLLQEPSTFECRLSSSGWSYIGELLIPFTDGSYFAESHQYLEENGEIRLIFLAGEAGSLRTCIRRDHTRLDSPARTR